MRTIKTEMNIDLEKAIGFIGHASSHPDLDDFLVKSGFKKRLTTKDLPLAGLEADNAAIELSFTLSYPEYYGPPHSDGFLFFEAVVIRNPKYVKKTGPIISKLPFGLRIEMIECDIVSLLGKPSMSGESWGDFVLIYNNLIKGMRVSISLDIKSREIIAIHISPVRIDLKK